MGSFFSKKKCNQRGREWRDGSFSRNANSNSSTSRSRNKVAKNDLLRNFSNNRSSRRRRFTSNEIKLRKGARYCQTVDRNLLQDKLARIDKVKSYRSQQNNNNSKRNRKTDSGKQSETRACRLRRNRQPCTNRRRRRRLARRDNKTNSRTTRRRKDTKTNRRRAIRKQKEGRRQRKRRVNISSERRQLLKPVYGYQRHIEKMLTPQDTIVSRNLDKGLDDVKVDPLSELCRSLVKSIPGIPADGRNPVSRKNAKPEMERDTLNKKDKRKNKNRRRCRRSTKKVACHKSKTLSYGHSRRGRKKCTTKTKTSKHQSDRRDSSPRFKVSKAYKQLSKMVKEQGKRPRSGDDAQIKNKCSCSRNKNNVCCNHHHARKLPRFCQQSSKQDTRYNSEISRPRGKCCCRCHKQGSHKFKNNADARSQRRRKTDERSQKVRKCKVRRKK